MIVLFGKPIAALVIVLAFGYPVRVALAVAVALAQIGEFSFILATLGNRRNLNLLPDDAVNALVAASIVSISVNPLLYRLVDPTEVWAARRPRLWRWLTLRIHPATAAASSEPAPAADPAHRAVIVGFGPVGRTLTRLLRENGIEPFIIEMDLDRVHRLRGEGLTVIYGDANHHDTLKSAGIDQAGALILAASNIRNPEEIIRLARELNPAVRILVRTNYLFEKPKLRAAGADSVFAGEGEIAMAMTEYVLRDLGATPEQIDRERERLHADLAGDVQSAVASHPPSDAKPPDVQDPGSQRRESS